MSGIDDIRAERIKKVGLLRDRGMDPYPATSNRTTSNKEFLDNFENAAEKEEWVGGRILSLRGQGGIIFADLFDGTARLQALIKKDEMKGDYELFEAAVDASDFIEVKGTPFTTKRGMKSVLAREWRMLAKSLRPVPSEWFGIKDEDERYRKRYLDMLLDPKVAEIAYRRSIFWNTARTFLLERGFVEVETPVLETMTGGAEARPFETYHNALEMDVYLRISAGELWQKKLLVGGLPKTFEIGRIFRNEGMSYSHAQDYTQLEFYEAYSDFKKGMPMITELYRLLAEKTFGTQAFTVNGFEVDLSKKWDVVDFNELMQKKYGVDFRDPDALEDTLPALAKKHGIEMEGKNSRASVGRIVDGLWKEVRKGIGGPAFLIGVPEYLEPLAKRSADNPKVVERFQVLLGGSEVGKAFSELNDPEDQRERFERQQKLREAGDEEAQMADYEYVEAMEYGMPPALGFGVSERLFSFLAGISIREGQLFPLMRPK